MGILHVKDLRLTLGDTSILNGLSFELWEGYVHAIIGPNGSGKSTLASTIMGLSGYQGFEGDILFKGTSLKGKTVDERARMGITLGWQEPARFEGLKVKDFLMASAKNKSIEALKSTLDLVGIDKNNYLERSVDKTLSGGERKKIELASLLLMEPKLALLDEPDSGIDMDSIRKIFEAIALLKKQGATVLLITHSQDVLEHAEHAFLMCHGKIVDKGEIKGIGQYFMQKCQICQEKEPEKVENI